jgi:hypothetical protein
MKYHKLVTYKQHQFIFHNSKTGKSKIKALEESVFSKDPLLVQESMFLLHPVTVEGQTTLGPIL